MNSQQGYGSATGWDLYPGQQQAHQQQFSQPPYNQASYPAPQATFPAPGGQLPYGQYDNGQHQAPPPGYPGQGAGPSLGAAPYAQPANGPVTDEDGSRGLGTSMMQGGRAMARMGHKLHLAAHPVEAVQYNTTGKVKRKLHQKIWKVVRKVVPF